MRPIIKECRIWPPNKGKELHGWTQSQSLPAAHVFRAHLILAMADSLSYRQIEQTLGASAPYGIEMEGPF